MTQSTILVPAHNEAGVIDRTLLLLSKGLPREDFHVVVIANGCADATASKARSVMPDATVIETSIAGKAHALNLGYERAAKDGPVVCLDADLEITAEALKSLVAPLLAGEALASCGHMDVAVADAAAWVRAYYQGWRMNPYFDQGKFGGVFALSSQAAARIFPLPEITADDEYVRRSFGAADTAFIEACRFTARAPQTLASLVKVRRRSIRGARQVTGLGLPNPESRSLIILASRLLRSPRNLLPLATYGAVNAYVRMQLLFEPRSPSPLWERDLTTRVTG